MLVGKRVVLRAIEYDDLPLMVTWRNDPAIYKHFFEHEPLSLVMQKRWFEEFLNKPSEKLWVIHHVADDVAIGTMGLVGIDWRNRKGELARILIYPAKYRRSEYCSEAEALVIRYFFDTLNMHRLEGELYVENEAMLALHKKFGFRVECIFEDYVFKDGRYRDVTYIAMLRKDYESEQTQKRIERYIG